MVRIKFTEKWINAVVSAVQHNTHCIQLHASVGAITVSIICCYEPQSSLSTEEKRCFLWPSYQPGCYCTRIWDVASLWRYGEHSNSFKEIYGGHGYVDRNQDGLHLLNFFVADQLAIAKALFRNIVININIIIIVIIIIIITYYYENVRVIGSEECIIQHKLLICDITLSTKSLKPPYIPLQRKT